MTIEALTMIDPVAGPLTPRQGVIGSAGAGFTLNDVARFEAAMNGGSASGGAMSSAHGLTAVSSPGAMSPLGSESIKHFFAPLERINGGTDKIMAASEKMSANPDVGPGDMLLTMVTVQKFMFECQLTASVANRTSDGVQELFRQQS
jgi:hypothetical protein